MIFNAATPRLCQHGVGRSSRSKSEMEKLQSFQNKFWRKIKLGRMSSSEALKCLNWLPLAGRRLSHRCTAVENAIKGNILKVLNQH